MRTVIPYLHIRSLSHLATIAGAVFLTVSVLWKGGKTLEITWILVAMAWVGTVTQWRKSEYKNSSIAIRRVPMWLWGSILLFIAWTGMSYWYSTTKNYGFDEVLQTGALGLIFFWTIRQKKQQDILYHLQAILSYITIAACLIGVFVYVFQPVDRFVGTFFDFRFHTDYWPNAWAQFLLLSWPIVWLWVRKDRASGIFVLGLVFGCLLLSYSRAAIIVFIGQIILWLFLVRWDLQWKEKLIRLCAVSIIAIGVFFILNEIRGQFFPVQSVAQKVTFTADEGGSSVSERLDFWRQSLALAWLKPISGWGPYSFRFVQPRLQKDILATSDHPHNIFLKFAMERGIVVSILFAFIFGSVMFYAWRQKKEAMLIISVVGVLAHNLVDYNLQFVGIALPFWMILGVLASGELLSNDKFLFRISLQRFTEIFIATTIILLAVLEGHYLVISSLGRYAEGRGDDQRALLWYGHAQREVFSRDLFLSQTHLLINLQRYIEAEKSLADYMEKNTQDFRAWRLKGDLFFGKGHYDEALYAYDQAFISGRWNDLGILRGIIETMIKQKDDVLLKERLPDIEFLLRRFADAIKNNEHFIALSTNVEEYVRITDLLSMVYPDSAPRYQLLGARVDRYAREERERIISRGPGWLW